MPCLDRHGLAGATLGALLLAVAPASAQGLPQLHRVTGLGSDDVLNVRQAPTTGAPVIGTLRPDAAGVEVTARDVSERWGRVNTGEAAGWAALRYLAPEADPWPAGSLPPALACFGTEPFWSFRPGAGTAVFSTPDAGDRVLDHAESFDAGIDGDPRRAILATGPALRLTATIVPNECSDGMSDRAFGLEALLLVEDGPATRLFTGCCSIATPGE